MMSNEAAASGLTLDIDREGDQAAIRFTGRLTSGVASLLYAKVSELIPVTKRIVLDLTNLSDMDSMGLGTLVRLFISAKRAGCSIELVNLGPRIRRLLGITNLTSLFTVIGEQNIKIF